MCDYVKRKRIDLIEKEILSGTLSTEVPTFEFFVYNDAIRKGKILGLKEFIKTVPGIISLFDKELEQRLKKEAGLRKPDKGRKNQVR